MIPSIDKSSLPTTLKTGALETIDSYLQTLMPGYTDGSAFKDTANDGFGVFIRFPDDSDFEISEACGTSCSNYDAEIKGLAAAVELIHQNLSLAKRNQPSQ